MAIAVSMPRCVDRPVMQNSHNLSRVFFLGLSMAEIRRCVYRVMDASKEIDRIVVYRITAEKKRKNPYERLDGFVYRRREDSLNAFYMVPHFMWESRERTMVRVTIAGEFHGFLVREKSSPKWVFNTSREKYTFACVDKAIFPTVRDGAITLTRSFWSDNHVIKPAPDHSLVVMLGMFEAQTEVAQRRYRYIG